MRQIRHNDTFYLEARDGFEDWEFYYNMMSRPAIELLQYETPMVNFFDYALARNFIKSFKNGIVEDAIWAAKLVSMFLSAHGLTGCEYTFIAVPASTPERHKARYSIFMSEVCRLTGMNNGYGIVNVTASRIPAHNGGRRDLQNFTVDPSVA